MQRKNIKQKIGKNKNAATQKVMQSQLNYAEMDWKTPRSSWRYDEPQLGLKGRGGRSVNDSGPSLPHGIAEKWRADCARVYMKGER